MAATSRPVRAASTRRNWYRQVAPAVQSALVTLATTTKDTLAIVPAPVPALPGVHSTITGGSLAAPVQGAYNSATGVHAEIEAIDNVGAANWAQALTITTDLEPCPRCAAILGAFVAQYGWTVRAPKNAFAANYVGAYFLPDAVYNVVVGRLSIGGPAALMDGEAEHYDAELKSYITAFAIS